MTSQTNPFAHLLTHTKIWHTTLDALMSEEKGGLKDKEERSLHDYERGLCPSHHSTDISKRSKASSILKDNRSWSAPSRDPLKASSYWQLRLALRLVQVSHLLFITEPWQITTGLLNAHHVGYVSDSWHLPHQES